MTAPLTIEPDLDRLIADALAAGFQWRRDGDGLGEFRPEGMTPEESAEIDRIRIRLGARWSEVQPVLLQLLERAGGRLAAPAADPDDRPPAA